jgi:putative copper resistance protein D
LLAARAGAALASAVLLVGVVAGQMSGSGALFDASATGLVVRDTLYGHIALARMTLLAAFLLIAWVAPAARLIAGTVLGGAALALLSLTSHAAAAGPAQFTALRAGIDGVHLLTAGFWLGGVMTLIAAVRREPRDGAKHVALLRLFSRWGSACVALLVAAGTFSGVAILYAPGMAWSPVYLTLLAVKLVLAGLMIALALTNRFSLLPGLARGEKEAAENLPLTLYAELGAALLIVLVVGFLGLTAPMQM